MKFIINPKNLTLNAINPETSELHKKHLISPEILAIMEKQQIDLSLEVFDSDADVKQSKEATIVLLHSNSTSQIGFKELIAYYSTSYRVIAIDLLGHGGSSKIHDISSLTHNQTEALSKAFYNFPALTAEVVQCLQHYGIQAAHIVGSGLGGNIGYGVAIEDPQLVSSITTLEAPPINISFAGIEKGYGEIFYKKYIPSSIEDPTRPGIIEAHTIAEEVGIDERSRDTFYAGAFRETDPLFREKLFKRIDDYQEEPVMRAEDFIRESKLPFCIMYGESDPSMNPEFFLEIKNVLKKKHPLSEVHSIKGQGGSALFKSEREQFLSFLTPFLAATESIRLDKDPTTLESSIAKLKSANAAAIADHSQAAQPNPSTEDVLRERLSAAELTIFNLKRELAHTKKVLALTQRELDIEREKNEALTRRHAVPNKTRIPSLDPRVMHSSSTKSSSQSRLESSVMPSSSSRSHLAAPIAHNRTHRPTVHRSQSDPVLILSQRVAGSPTGSQKGLGYKRPASTPPLFGPKD